MLPRYDLQNTQFGEAEVPNAINGIIIIIAASAAVGEFPRAFEISLLRFRKGMPDERNKIQEGHL